MGARDLAPLRAKVERTANLATIPQVVARLRGMLVDPSASAVTIGAEIEKDQVLAAKVLKLVNSGFYGFHKTISTITQAMVLLGFDVVEALVLTASVLDVIDAMNKRLVGLWDHSLAAARVAEAVANRMKLANPEELAAAGLLHDIGKVVVAQKLPIEHARIRRLIAGRGCLQLEAEREVLGATHGDVARWLLERWHLPERLVAPIAGHHEFDPDGPWADRVAVIDFADVTCRALGLGYPGDSLIPALHPDAWEILHLTREDVEVIVGRVQAEWAGVGA